MKDVKSFTSKTEEAIFLSWNPSVVQGADVLVVREGVSKAITASAPVPWPSHIKPGTQKWKLIQGPKGERLWYGDQGGLVWGEMTSQIAKDTLTLEERTSPPIRKKDMDEFKDIDQLARVLRGGEDITQSSLQRFYPGLVGLAITDIDDEPIEPLP